MKKTKIGEQYIRFRAEGLKEAERQTQQSSGRMMRTWADLRRSVAGGLRGMLGAATAIAAPMAGLLAFARSASQGTREGQQMATAWTYLSHVIGSMFAPAIRTATTILVRIADIIAGLSPQTKTWIALAAVASAGVIALAGAVTVASVAFGGLATMAGIAWAVITAPITLTIATIVGLAAAIAAIGVAILGIIGYLGMLGDAGKLAGTSWVGAVVNGARIVATTIADVLNWTIRQFIDFHNWMMDKAAQAADFIGATENAASLRGMMFADTNLIDTNKLDGAFKLAEKWVEDNIPTFGQVGDFITNSVERAKALPGLIKQLMSGASDGVGMKFTPKVTVGFESLQQSFDRLQEAFAKGTESDKLDQIRAEGQKTNEILDKILNKIGLGGIVS